MCDLADFQGSSNRIYIPKNDLALGFHFGHSRRVLSVRPHPHLWLILPERTHSALTGFIQPSGPCPVSISLIPQSQGGKGRGGVAVGLSGLGLPTGPDAGAGAGWGWLAGPSPCLELPPSALPFTVWAPLRETVWWLLIHCPHPVVSRSEKETLRLGFG